MIDPGSESEVVLNPGSGLAPGDRGRVIGRQGRTADALRTLLEAVGRRRGIECDMEVVD